MPYPLPGYPTESQVIPAGPQLRGDFSRGWVKVGVGFSDSPLLGAPSLASRQIARTGQTDRGHNGGPDRLLP